MLSGTRVWFLDDGTDKTQAQLAALGVIGPIAPESVSLEDRLLVAVASPAAREAILRRGGAASCNVFTRIALALFGQLPWRGVPYVPVEIVLLPAWFPFNLHKVSYWSRTVMLPLGGSLASSLCDHTPA